MADEQTTEQIIKGLNDHRLGVLGRYTVLAIDRLETLTARVAELSKAHENGITMYNDLAANYSELMAKNRGRKENG